jgi:hypothetical protein
VEGSSAGVLAEDEAWAQGEQDTLFDSQISWPR